MAYDRKEQRIEGPYAPLGPLYIASCLREANVQPSFFDGTHASSLRDFAAALDSERPQILGIYATVISRHVALQMAKLAHHRGIPVIAGGPDPSSDPNVYLRSGLVNVVARGEGEVSAVNLGRYYLESSPSDLQDIPGLSVRENSGILHTDDQPYIEDLDLVPYPARDLMDWPAYEATTRRFHGVSQLTIMTARGCPFQCTWCCKPIFGARYRHRSPGNVVGEILEVKTRYGPGMVRFADDILTINRRKFMELADEIERAGAQIPFECLTRVDLVDKEVLQRLVDIGCRKILYGVESGSQRVLDSMKKGIKVQEVHEISRLTRALGMEQYWFLIYGYPPEDIHDLRLTIDMVRRLQPDDYGITVAYPLPQTEFYDLVRHSMQEGTHWKRTRDNLVLYRHLYSSLFYKAAIYGTHLVYRTRRMARANSGILARAVDRMAYGVTDAVLGGWAGRAGG
ncbi:MAG: B12-binding domain-containing radical SAM protein [Thermoplasmata archaeon]